MLWLAQACYDGLPEKIQWWPQSHFTLAASLFSQRPVEPRFQERMNLNDERFQSLPLSGDEARMTSEAPR